MKDVHLCSKTPEFFSSFVLPELSLETLKSSNLLKSRLGRVVNI